MLLGAMSIFVRTTMKGIFRNREIPRCSLVILDTPMFEPTMIIE